MDISLILSIIVIFFLVFCFIYLIFIFPKRQQKLLKIHLDSLSNQNQQKEASEFEERNEEAKKICS